MVTTVFKFVLAALIVIPMGIGIFLFLKKLYFTLMDEVERLKK